MFEVIAEALGMAFPWFILVVMVLGLMGLVIPIFPGNMVIWAGALVFGLVNGFDSRAIWFFVPITLITLAAFSADNVLMGAKAKQAGAAWSSIGIALVAAFITSVFLTPLAGLIAAPLSLFLAEFFRNQQDGKLAWKVTSGLMMGCGWAFVVRFGLGLITIGLYAWWAFGGKA
jgi:uncharacterized protein YqgC (DUF456 family)